MILDGGKMRENSKIQKIPFQHLNQNKTLWFVATFYEYLTTNEDERIKRIEKSVQSTHTFLLYSCTPMWRLDFLDWNLPLKTCLVS